MPIDRAGSMDDKTTHLLYGDDYEFTVVVHALDSFSLYRGTNTRLSKAEIVENLRHIANYIEASSGGERR